MARKAFLLRVDPKLLDALQGWADEELRSLNGQIEYVLRTALNHRRTARKVKEDEQRHTGDSGLTEPGFHRLSAEQDETKTQQKPDAETGERS
jgi:hypothetical protein